MKRKGFTLAEVLIAVILIGLAIASLVASNISFTRANGDATNLSTAEFLLEQIKEFTTTLEYEGLRNSPPFSPPIKVNGAPFPPSEFPGFTQQVTVENVSPANFQPASPSDFLRITVTVSLNAKPVCSSAWIRARY